MDISSTSQLCLDMGSFPEDGATNKMRERSGLALSLRPFLPQWLFVMLSISKKMLLCKAEGSQVRRNRR